jgi:hypothetical protein
MAYNNKASFQYFSGVMQASTLIIVRVRYLLRRAER